MMYSPQDMAALGFSDNRRAKRKGKKSEKKSGIKKAVSIVRAMRRVSCVFESTDSPQFPQAPPAMTASEHRFAGGRVVDRNFILLLAEDDDDYREGIDRHVYRRFIKLDWYRKVDSQKMDKGDKINPSHIFRFKDVPGSSSGGCHALVWLPSSQPGDDSSLPVAIMIHGG